MNDAPTITDAPSLDGKAIAELAEERTPAPADLPHRHEAVRGSRRYGGRPGSAPAATGKDVLDLPVGDAGKHGPASHSASPPRTSRPSRPAPASSGSTRPARSTPRAARWRACGSRTARPPPRTRPACRACHRGATTAWWCRRCAPRASTRRTSACSTGNPARTILFINGWQWRSYRRYDFHHGRECLRGQLGRRAEDARGVAVDPMLRRTALWWGGGRRNADGLPAGGPAACGDGSPGPVEGGTALSDHAVRPAGRTGGRDGEELRREELRPRRASR